MRKNRWQEKKTVRTKDVCPPPQRRRGAPTGFASARQQRISTLPSNYAERLTAGFARSGNKNVNPPSNHAEGLSTRVAQARQPKKLFPSPPTMLLLIFADACLKIARSIVQDEIPAENTKELRANLEAARKEAASHAGEAKQSKELEEQLRGELHASRLALRESESKVAELKGILATAEHEKALSTTAVKELRLESARLKRNMELVRSAPDGDTMRELTDTLVSELEELRTQLTAVVLER